MNRKRIKLEVIRDILEVLNSNSNVKKTHIIYKANLSNNSAKLYLGELLKNNFLEEFLNNGKKYFRITPKGNEFLREFNKMKVFSESFGLSLDN